MATTKKPYVLSNNDAVAINEMNQTAANAKLPIYSDLLASLALLAQAAQKAKMPATDRSLKKAVDLLEVMRPGKRP